jgi:hypothetical protein
MPFPAISILQTSARSLGIRPPRARVLRPDGVPRSMALSAVGADMAHIYEYI